MILRNNGYESDTLLANAALGVFDGIDSVLWCYGFAAIIFTGTLSAFLPLGLAILLGGWALLSIAVALTSRAPVHMIAIDEQAVVIIGSIGVAMMASFGEQATSLRGLATMLAIISLVSFTVAISFFCVSRFHLARLLELLPYPVICGFMAGIGWLLLDAGIMVALDTSISTELWGSLQQDSNPSKLAVCLAGGLFLLFFTHRVERTWALPGATTIILLVFYGVVFLSEPDVSSLRADGWIFNIHTPDGGISQMIATLTWAHVDTAFIVSVWPQLATVVFLTLLAASMNLSAMTVINLKAGLNSAEEMQGLGRGNLLCALIGCPPGYSDAPASILYEGFGATSRWMPLASSAVCLLVLVSGDWFVSYTPKVLIGATIFLFAFQLFYDWMYVNVRSFSFTDYLIVCIILLTVIGFGFMQGILVGVLLTVLVFITRYSLIPAIQDQFSLIDHRSSVERSLSDDQILEAHGGETLVYTLRGYLFFGTANTVRDTIRENIEQGRYAQILLDMRRVTGIDISAMNAFAQLKKICDVRQVVLLYVCSEPETGERLIRLDAVSRCDDRPQIFPSADYAIEQMEERLLDKYSTSSGVESVRFHLLNLLKDEEKVDRLLQAMVRIECDEGEFLFHQGDADLGFYLLESGHMSATIDTGWAPSQRVKRFSTGSVIGEMSSYTSQGTRSASVSANTSAVLYYLNPDNLGDRSIVHELVARTMGARMEYMNRRLMWELV
jgi:SulP family sulfate permease